MLNDQTTRFSVDDKAARTEIVRELPSCENANFSIEHKNGAILTILLNPQRAFVMWMKESGDEGQHAVDQDADGSNSQDFVLANGQIDEFCDVDTVSREAALFALAHFLETCTPSPQLLWNTP